MFRNDYDFEETLTGSDLLTEIGLDPRAIQDIIDDDRARRCPDRDTVLPPRRIADFTTETPLERTIRKMPLAEILSPSPPRRPSKWSERRA